MAAQGEDRSKRTDAGPAWPTRGYDEYRSARERYFEFLRVDSEIRRLEKLWRLPAARDRP